MLEPWFEMLNNKLTVLMSSEVLDLIHNTNELVRSTEILYVAFSDCFRMLIVSQLDVKTSLHSCLMCCINFPVRPTRCETKHLVTLALFSLIFREILGTST